MAEVNKIPDKKDATKTSKEERYASFDHPLRALSRTGFPNSDAVIQSRVGGSGLKIDANSLDFF